MLKDGYVGSVDGQCGEVVKIVGCNQQVVVGRCGGLALVLYWVDCGVGIVHVTPYSGN